MLRRMMMAGAGMPTMTTWDGVVKATEVTLFDGGMGAKIGGGVSWRTVLATTSKSSGKWQFEVVALTGGIIVGLANRGDVPSLLANYLGSATGAPEKIGYFATGVIYRNFSTGVGNTPVLGFASGDTITVAVNLDAATASFYRNGALITNQALPAGKTWWPAAAIELAKQARLRPLGLIYPVAGYADWG